MAYDTMCQELPHNCDNSNINCECNAMCVATTPKRFMLSLTKTINNVFTKETIYK